MNNFWFASASEVRAITAVAQAVTTPTGELARTICAQPRYRAAPAAKVEEIIRDARGR